MKVPMMSRNTTYRFFLVILCFLIPNISNLSFLVLRMIYIYYTNRLIFKVSLVDYSKILIILLRYSIDPFYSFVFYLKDK